MMNTQCTILQLHGNAITSQGIMILVDALLHNNTTLKDLWLSNNCVSDLGVQTLTRTFLANDSTLMQLHLGSNCITDRGVQYLAEILKRNRTLTDLWLYNNQIGDQGVQLLANVLLNDNCNLKHLDLQWNKLVTDSSVNSLVKMLERNRSLERLNLRKCNLSVTEKKPDDTKNPNLVGDECTEDENEEDKDKNNGEKLRNTTAALNQHRVIMKRIHLVSRDVSIQHHDRFQLGASTNQKESDDDEAMTNTNSNLNQICSPESAEDASQAGSFLSEMETEIYDCRDAMEPTKKRSRPKIDDGNDGEEGDFGSSVSDVLSGTQSIKNG
ncbi:unnamed protein product [Rotaria sp. Silwood2]|nr:unnamed protein product [Rotaria sp. Silwood2]CAF3089082.1 unnamed protein product [Rotaria sp. Silwood2]CAF3427133.1 unnamed protein product [Rotaria sp. Silwood2]CAF4361307.1 unnamed protein product [Rotaria sp. Silwood2]CAF4483746.1 unnamed protein product [Rotaria sp. Silwood2]